MIEYTSTITSRVTMLSKLISKLRRLNRSYLDPLFGSTAKYSEELLAISLEAYKTAGLQYEKEELVDNLNMVLDKLSLPRYSESQGMYSEHLLLFTALSLSGKPIRRILEIGTYDGVTALILSELFSASSVTTIDLPDHDPIFKSTYNRNSTEKLDQFLSERKSRLHGRNIKFVQINSLALTVAEYAPFDLVWVDGAHGYPTVAFDICNAYRLLSSDGVLMCDDVYLDLHQSDHMYRSIATYQVLDAMREASLLNTILFPKRIFVSSSRDVKYVSLSHPNSFSLRK